jgi:beta-lactamase regulating signal transducer with metallopeptidase domain
MFSWLAFNTLCALPLAVLALLARRLPRVPPAVEHLLWLFVLVRLVLPPFSLSPSDAAPTGGPSASAIVSSGPPSLGDELVASTTRLLGPNWSSWGAQVLLGAFLAALLFVVVRELLRARAVERCVSRAEAAEVELERHVRGVAGRLGVPAPRVRISREVSGPFLWSLRRPVLVLPESQGLPEPTVLAHEFAHLQRRDHWTAWLELFVQGFHFWNPLFWIARRQLHRAAELACDGWAVQRFPDGRRNFAAALVDTAERASRGGFVPRAAQAIGMDRRDFEERLVRILRGGTGARSQRGLLVMGLLCAGLTLPGGIAPSLAGFRRALPDLPAGTDHEHWRRRLAAAEERLRTDPKDGAAEMQRGIALLGLDRASDSLQAFERQQELGFQPAKALYNQACALVRLGELDAALVCLAHAADLGLDVASFVASDPDLAALRGHPDLPPN